MDLIYPDTSFCEQSLRLLDSLNGAKPMMALEDEINQENVQELLKLLRCIKNNSNEAQVESHMSSLAEVLDDEDVDPEPLEREQLEAHRIIMYAMQDFNTSCKIQLHGCYALFRLVLLSPKVRSQLQRKHAQRFILKMMERHVDNMCQVVGCKLLSALCTSASTKRDALSSGAIDTVLSAMSRFGEDEEFYIPAFEALTRLLSDDQSAQTDFISMDVKDARKKYRMVVEIMEKHAKSGEPARVYFPCFLGKRNVEGGLISMVCFELIINLSFYMT